MFKKNKFYVFSSLFIVLVILVSVCFTFNEKDNKSKTYDFNWNDFTTYGPYIGCISDSNIENIDIYTKVNGEYITSVDSKIVSNFLNQNHKSEEQNARKIVADFYCGSHENLNWIYAVSKPTFHSSIVNLYTSLSHDNEIKNYYFDITDGGVVTGAVFVTEKIGFIGLNVPTEIGFEIYTTLDAGASWTLVEIAPPSEWSNSYSLTPLAGNPNINEYMYPFVIDKISTKELIYLTTYDNGKTWCWKK